MRIGLALSGGGSRAIAFHLGCLRALHELGVLDKITVISTVSGGSVIGGLYAAHQGSFPEFEDRVCQLLRQGLMRSTFYKAFTTTEGLWALCCWAILLIVGAVYYGLRLAAKVMSLCSLDPKSRWRHLGWHPPIRRFASTTTILRRVLDDIFEGKRLCDLPAQGSLFIILAADLGRGSAFYFSRQNSGSWRLGKLVDCDISLAHAVTASAAYPLILPALDEVLTFKREDGQCRNKRITLTDGGVYDNLGLAPLWPDRDPQISLNVTNVDGIICCRAGYGSPSDSASPFHLDRLFQAFTCVHNRSQNAATKRLFDLKESDRLKGILLPYLGQDDSRLGSGSV